MTSPAQDGIKGQKNPRIQAVFYIDWSRCSVIMYMYILAYNLTQSQCIPVTPTEYEQHPLFLRSLQPSSSHWAESGQHEFWTWPGGFCQAPLEYAGWPGRPCPPLQGQLELGCGWTTLCFVPDQEEENSPRGEEKTSSQHKLSHDYKLSPQGKF